MVDATACAIGEATPSTLRSAVENGISTTSSWSCPIPDWPFVARTPTTFIWTFFTRMVVPTGS